MFSSLSVDQLGGYEAVMLYCERAKAVVPYFSITEENATAIGEICARLQGLPLAIELAAARLKIFPLEELARRLEERLDLLKSSTRGTPERQQTLRNEIKWSYDLLSTDGKLLFLRLSVFFSGGCNLEAAEAICGSDNLRIDVVDGLASLVDKSLLIRQELGGVIRFTMLEIIRDYAREIFAKSGEWRELKKRHAHFFLAFAEKAEPFCGDSG